MNKWYIENGEQGDIVISTRVRLARNLEDYPFPCRLTVKGKEKVCEEIKNAVLSNDNWGFGFTWMKDFNRSQAVSLAERHLISPEFASDRAGRSTCSCRNRRMTSFLRSSARNWALWEAR